MAVTKRNYVPNEYEAITTESIGSLVIDTWSYFELDSYYKFLVSDVVITYSGGTVPSSAYELQVDSKYTSSETGLTDKTLYGMIKITNATYAGTELFVTGNNFGTYTDNEATVAYINSLVANPIPAGLVFDFAGTVLPTNTLWLKKEPYTVSQATESRIYSAFGSIDFFAPDAASAATAAAATEFYLPGVLDLYVKGTAIHGIATFDNTTNSLTIADVNGDTIDDSWRNGTPIRFVGDTMPTDITEYVTYYLYYDSGNSRWELYTTEAGAFDGSGTQRTFSSDGSNVYATQYGITQDDAMQQITGTMQGACLIRNTYADISYSGALKSDTVAGNTTSSATTVSNSENSIDFDSSLSTSPATAKTSPNQTRGRETFMKKVITR